MKRIISFILAIVGLLTAPVAFAQSSTKQPFTQSSYYAVDYGQWAIRGQSPNLFQFSPGGLCAASASGSNFFPFATNAPVLITDATPANSEVVTIANPTNGSSTCGFTASPSNSHTSFQVSSGTGGLQESLNALAVIGGQTTIVPAKIVLDRNWYVLASSVPGTTAAAILAASKGNAHAFLSDETTSPATNYVWTGTTYSSTAATWVNTAPTAAAGAGAGTSPTISNSGTALAGTVSLTSGTATTTGALFTLTWISTQFQYAPTCTVVSSGTNSYTTFTIATTHPSGGLLTATVATTAPIASTAYKFTYNCK